MLTDDRQARLAAQRHGLNSLGLVGILLDAKRKGIISSIAQMLDDIQQKGGLYLSDIVKARARMLAEEQ